MTEHLLPSAGAVEAASDWYNTQSKAQIIRWATERGLDIGQHGGGLYEDWHEIVIGEYAKGGAR